MGVFDVIGSIGKAVGGALDSVDMMSGLVEDACDLIGVPKEITGALKVAVGIMTEDYCCVAAGGAELAGSVAQDLSKSAKEGFDRPASSVLGYVDSGLNAALSTDAKANAAPTAEASAKAAAEAATADACKEAGTTAGSAIKTFSEVTEHLGGKVQTPDTSDTMGDQELKELQVLFNNFDAIDSRYQPPDSFAAKHLRDGHIDMDDLQSLSDAVGTPEDVKRAARYLMDHPDVYNKLARTDGAITTTDIKMLMEDRRAELSGHSAPTTGGSHGNPPGIPNRPGNTPPGGTCSGSSNGSSAADDAAFGANLNSILHDPTLSMEEKIERILMMVEQRLDKELGQKLSQYAQKQTDHVDMTREGSTDNDAKAAAEQNTNDQKSLEFDIQKLVEREKSMFDLMSNIQSKFSEMANTAIQNMGRA